MKISKSSLLCWFAMSLAVSGCAGLPSAPRFGKAPPPAAQSTESALARLCERRGEVDKARQIYTGLLQRNPRDAESHHRLAVIACREGQFSQADAHFRQALAIAPQHPMVLSDLGYALYLQNRLPEAEQALQRALEADPQLASAQNNLGLVLGQQQRYNESLAMFRRAGSEAEAYANLAFVHAQQGHLDPAEALYSQALSVNNKMRPAAHGLMQVAQRKRQMNRQAAPAQHPLEQHPTAIAQAQPQQPSYQRPQQPAPPPAPWGAAAPPQYALTETPAPRAGEPAMPALAQTAVPPGRRFTADEFVELVDVSEPVPATQPLSPEHRTPLAQNADPRELGQLISTGPAPIGPPSRFASGPFRRTLLEERSQPEIVQVSGQSAADFAARPEPQRTPEPQPFEPQPFEPSASYATVSDLESISETMPPLARLPAQPTPVSPPIQVELTAPAPLDSSTAPRLQMRYAVPPATPTPVVQGAEGSQLSVRTLDHQPSSSSEPAEEARSPQTVLRVEAVAAPAEQPAPRTVFHLGTPMPSEAPPAATQPSEVDLSSIQAAPTPAAAPARDAENATSAPTAETSATAAAAKEATEGGEPASDAATEDRPHLSAKDSTHWSAAAPRYSNSKSQQRRRLGHEFRMTAPQPFSSESNVSPRPER